jgi:hypothetical protein
MKANTFASTFYFFPAHKPTLKNKKCLQTNAPDSAVNSSILTRINNGRTEARTDNSGFAKKRVQWLIEHSTSHQILWYVDNLVLRNPLLRKAAKRYASCYDDRANIKLTEK